MKRILGIPREPLEPPWDPRDRSGTPLGPHRDALGTPREPGAHHGPQKRSHLNKFTAPEALGCYIRILVLQRISPVAPLDHFVIYDTRTEPLVGPQALGLRTLFSPVLYPLVPSLYIDIYIYVYGYRIDVHIYINDI